LIVARLKTIRVPTLLLRAESGFIPGQPPLFPDALAAQFRNCLPHLEDHKLAGTTHYTIALGESAASRIADLICELATRLRTGETRAAG